MRDLSLHMLDVAENSVEAGASKIWLTLKEDTAGDRFELSIKDNGTGIDIEKKADDAYYTEKKKRFGLGLPLLEQATSECNGGFSISRRPGGGTEVTAWFQRGHIDIKPLGDVGSTVAVLATGHRNIDFVLLYEKDDLSYRFDTGELKRELGGLLPSAPEVLQYIRDEVNDGIRRIRE
jgi:hypothetical protein